MKLRLQAETDAAGQRSASRHINTDRGEIKKTALIASLAFVDELSYRDKAMLMQLAC
jgi:hypothetical protein